jgi:hypothetical protein
MTTREEARALYDETLRQFYGDDAALMARLAEVQKEEQERAKSP